jgi:hypothetical protein
MQRARRLACSAVVAFVALAGLAACRSEPGVAVYLGNRTITMDRINAVYDDARTKLETAVDKVRAQQAGKPGAQPVPATVDLPISRQDVLAAIVGVDVLKGYAQRKGVSPEPVTAQDVVQEIPLPADSEYIKMAVEYRGYINGLAVAATPATPTEADLRDVYRRLGRAGGFGPGGAVPFEEWTASLTAQQQQVLRQFVGLRNELSKEVAGLKATVNPRFGAAELPLLPFADANGKPAPLVVLPLAPANGPAAVSDRA